MKITITITKATVLLTHGADKVVLQTDKPPPFPPAVSIQSLDLEFNAARGSGIEYCRQHFGIEPKVIDTIPHRKRK